MATTFNAFTALVGSQDALAAAGKKKKKNNASKPKTAEQPQPSKAPATEAPVPAAPQGPAVVPVVEAVAITEKTARTYKSGADRIKLWKDWIKQGNDRGSQIKYKEADGTVVDFRKMYVQSRALDITVESCITSPVAPQNESQLQQLLATFLSCGEATAASLASAIVRLAELLSEDAPDTLGAAQRAVSSVIASLKSGGASSSSKDASHVTNWVNRVSDISKEISRQQTFLQKLAQTSGGIITKEQTACAIKIVRLQAQRFDLLQPMSLPSAGSSNSSSSSLISINELKSVISAHMKAAEASGSKSSSSQASASIKREETLLAQQAQELASQIKTLEAQLAALRVQAQEVQDRRAQLQQSQRATFETVKGKGAAAAPAAGGLPATHYKEELAAANLLASLVDPSAAGSSAEEVEELVASQGNVAVDYVLTAQQFLSMSLTQLAEIPQRVNFSKQRVAHAEQLLKLSAASDRAVKQKQEAEKLLDDAVGAADEILAASKEVLSSVRTRYEQLSRSSPEQAATLAKHIADLDEVNAAITQQYMSVQAVLQPSMASAAPAPYTAPLGNGTMPAVAPAAPAPVPFTQGVPVPAPVAPAVAAAPVAKPGPIAKPNQKPAPPAAAAAPPAAPALSPAAANTADQVVAPPKAPAAPAAAPAPTRQWAKVQAAPVESSALGDDSAPTPAEAFMPAGTSASAAEGFKSAGKKNRRKA